MSWILAVAGDVDPAAIARTLDTLLAGWTGEHEEPVESASAPRGYRHVDQPSAQLHIGLAYDAPREVDEDSIFTDDDGDGLSEDEGDCDDSDPSVVPGADERENGVDDDCDGLIDEDFEDADGDGVLKGDEIPGMMQDHLDKIDANGDGAIDAEELGAMAEKRRGFKRERGKN